MSKSLLLLDGTQKMHKDGYNPAILALIEQKHLEDAVRFAKAYGHMMGEVSDPAQVLRIANESLPKGDHLAREYVRTRDTVSSLSLRELDEVSKRLTLTAERLETMAARGLIASEAGKLNLPQRADMEQRIGEGYAQVIEAARKMESLGMISSHKNAALEKLTDAPSGPLKDFFPKAMAIVESNEQKSEQVHARMR